MNDNGIENNALRDKQLRVIPFLLQAPSVEEGCKRAKVGKVTVYAWLKQEAFREELRRQREEVVRGALETLKANTAMEWLNFNADGTEPEGPEPSGFILLGG